MGNLKIIKTGFGYLYQMTISDTNNQSLKIYQPVIL